MQLKSETLLRMSWRDLTKCTKCLVETKLKTQGGFVDEVVAEVPGAAVEAAVALGAAVRASVTLGAAVGAAVGPSLAFGAAVGATVTYRTAAGPVVGQL